MVFLLFFVLNTSLFYSPYTAHFGACFRLLLSVARVRHGLICFRKGLSTRFLLKGSTHEQLCVGRS